VQFLGQYPEAARALGSVGCPPEEAVGRIYDLYRRHGLEVLRVMTEGHQRHAGDYMAGALPDSCLLILGAPERYRKADTDERTPTFRRNGDHWEVDFANERVTIKDVVGMRFIAFLLERPGQAWHVLQLRLFDSGIRQVSSSDGGDFDEEDGSRTRRSPAMVGEYMTDGKAVRALQSRLRRIEKKIAASVDVGDGTPPGLREEAVRIQSYLKATTGLGNKPRPACSENERERQSVTRALGRAVGRLATAHEPLSRHLRRYLRKGEFCAYDPDPLVTWNTR
jgi:hypothetical protein